jgi:vacuolar-type H+-ATPase subunit H
MTLIIKRFKTTLKGRKEYPNKNKARGKRSCFKCGKTGHFIAQCPDNDNDNDQEQEKHGKREKKKVYKKAKGEAHLGKEWDSDCFSSDSDDEGLAASTFNKSSLFPNERHTCLMAKEKKVSVRDTPKYSTSSDEDSSDDEVDYSSLFKGLDRAKVEKINELIDALNEKDRLLEKQEDILYEEHDKFVSFQKSIALETKRNEMLSSELSACHETVSSLKSSNYALTTKLEGVNKFSSCEEHVVICDRCKDFDVDACDEHLISITKLNDDVASLNARLKTCKNDFDKLKFARDVYTIGRHPSFKDGLGFRKEAKNLTSQRTPIPNKEKGTTPMASSNQKNRAFIYNRKFASHSNYNRDYDHDAFDSHAMFASSSTFVHGTSRPRRSNVVPHVARRMCNEPSTIYHACNTSFELLCKNEKVVARKLGSKCKGDKTCIWVPKAIVTNLVGPNKSWVPKTQV